MPVMITTKALTCKTWDSIPRVDTALSRASQKDPVSTQWRFLNRKRLQCMRSIDKACLLMSFQTFALADS
jgi:hypothetical protein